MINWFSFNALTILKDICISSVDASESFSRPVIVKQLVDTKHPVGVHVFDGVQVHLLVAFSIILCFSFRSMLAILFSLYLQHKWFLLSLFARDHLI